MLDKIFSIKDEDLHKVITILGIKFKFPWKLHERALKELLIYARRENPSKNLDIQPAQNLKLHMARIAADDSARFIMKNCINAPTFKNRLDLLTYSLSKVETDGMYLEFGVFNGRSINHIAKQIPDKHVYGFDSFEGLPEDWQSAYPKGYFSMDNLPKVEKNVTLIKGWFDDTLPKFVEEHKNEKVAFINSDSDLYSSTKTTLECLKNNVQSGTIIQFDEYLNYPGWEDNEYKAFMEFIEATGYKYEYIGYVPTAKQMAIRIYK